jgi:hypothetical protein
MPPILAPRNFAPARFTSAMADRPFTGQEAEGFSRSVR